MVDAYKKIAKVIDKIMGGKYDRETEEDSTLNEKRCVDSTVSGI
jgi:hypothetical protein